MDILSEYIGNSSYMWVPIVALIVIILLGALAGWINGWKTSLYFFGWNLVGVISGVLLTPTVVTALNGIEFLKAFIASVEEVFGILILFVYMFVINLFAFMFYWIFRSKLKAQMTINDNTGYSNTASRFIGMGIAIVSVAPTATFIADSSAIMSNENGYTKFLDKLTIGFTGGRYGGTAEARILVKNIKSITDLIKAFGDSGVDSLNDPKTKTALQEVLNTSFAGNVGKIYEALKSSSLGSSINPDSINNVKAADIKNNIPPMGIKLLPERKAQLTKSLTTLFKGNPEKLKIVSNIISELTS